MEGAAPDGDLTQSARERVRASVSSLVGRIGSGLTSPTALTALLSSSALAPIAVATGSGPATLAVAAANLVGGVGTNFLSDRIDDALQARRNRRAEDDVEAVEKALVRAITVGLADPGDQGAALADDLRRALGQVLGEVGAAHAAVEAAALAGDVEVLQAVVGTVHDLRSDVASVADQVDDLQDLSLEILAGINQAIVELRAGQEELRAQSKATKQIFIAIRNIRDQVQSDADPAADPGHTVDEPYPGLRPFEPTDRRIFFGRQAAVNELLEVLPDHLEAPSVVVVTGPSGVGKSSLVSAGLIPALTTGLPGVEGSEHWAVDRIVLSSKPLDELAECLSRVADASDPGADASGLAMPWSTRPRQAAEFAAGLEHHPDRAYLTVQEALTSRRRLLLQRGEAPPHVEAPSRNSTRLVLIVDQFERIFTGTGDLRQVDDFLTALLAMACSPYGEEEKPPALVIPVLRGDYWDACASDPRLADLLRQGQFLVTPMRREELVEAVRGPATVAGLRVADGLTDGLVEGLRARTSVTSFESTALPLLAQALHSTHAESPSGDLTWEAYGQTGGVTRAVEHSAEAAYASLSPAQQEHARAVFLQLARFDRDRRPTRVKVAAVDLGLANGTTEALDIEAVVDTFTERRLLVRDHDSVQISHDILLEAWPKLEGWLEADREIMTRHNRLVDRAAVWESAEREPSYLYRGTELQDAHDLLQTLETEPKRLPRATVAAHEFVAASLTADRRRRLQRRLAVTVPAVAAAMALLLGSLYLYQRQVTGDREAEATSRELAALSDNLANTDAALSSMLALAAYDQSPTSEAEQALLARYADNVHFDALFSGAPGAISRAETTPDGRTVAALGAGGEITLWVRAPGEPVERRQLNSGSSLTGRAARMALRDDGEQLAAVGIEEISGFDVLTGERVWEIPLEASDNPNATEVHFGGDDLVAVETGSAEGSGRIEVWNVDSPTNQPAQRLEMSTDLHYSIGGFLPNSDDLLLTRRQYTGSNDNGDPEAYTDDVYVWNVNTDAFETFSDADIHTVAAISPDGQVLGCKDTNQRSEWMILDLNGEVQSSMISPETTTCLSLQSVAIDATHILIHSPDGGWLLDVEQGEAFHQTTPSIPLTQDPLEGDVFSYSYARNLVSEGGRYRRLFWTENGVGFMDIGVRDVGAEIGWISSTPDERFIVSTTNYDSEIVVLRTDALDESGRPLSTEDDEVVVARAERPMARDPLGAIGISRDGSMLADHGPDGTIQVRSLPSLEVITEINSPLAEHELDSEILQFSGVSIGELIIVIAGMEAEWWDPDTGELVAEIDLSASRADPASFSSPSISPYSRHDSIIITSSDDRLVEFFDPASDRALTSISPGIDPTGVRVQGDDYLAVLSRSGFIEVWDLQESERIIGPSPDIHTPELGGELAPFVAEFLDEPGHFFVGSAGTLRWYEAGSLTPYRTLRFGTIHPEVLLPDREAVLYRNDDPLGGLDSEPWSPEVYLLELDPDRWQGHLCDIIEGRAFSPQERSRYPVGSAATPCR